MTRTRGLSVLAVAACAVLAVSVPSAGGIITPVGSTFDTGLDGWATNNPGEVSFSAGGGNPGGYCRFDDGSTGSAFILHAGGKFSGDWSALDGAGAIVYDHKIFSVGASPSFLPYEAVLLGAGGQARWYGATPTGTTPWTTVTVPLVSSAWSLGGSNWAGILSNVTLLMLRIEQVDDPGGVMVPDSAGIDNVWLIPEPASLALLALGGLALTRRRRG